MSLALESCDEIIIQEHPNPASSLVAPNVLCGKYVFRSTSEMNQYLSRLCYGNLYVIGRIWVQGLKTVLTGANFNLVPRIEAKEIIEPKKPGRMKFQELCVYEDSQLLKYRDHELDKEIEQCSAYNKKILHSQLFPYVSEGRKAVQSCFCDALCYVKCIYCDVVKYVDDTANGAICYMRCDQNIQIRRGLFISSGIIGYYVGRRFGKSGHSIIKGLLGAGIGTFATGNLCFPKETDEGFREICYEVGQFGTSVYNFYTGNNFGFSKRLPCTIPERPKPRKEQCPEKK